MSTGTPQQSGQPVPRKRRWWHRPIPLAFCVLIVASVALAWYAWYVWEGYHREAEERLQEAFAETDRLDPGWRLMELEAARAVIPEKQNSALHILAVAKQIPNEWSAAPEFWELFETLPPERQLNEMQTKALRAERAKVAVLPAARKLKELSNGRYPIAYQRNWFKTTVSGHEARTVANLLNFDVLLRAHEMDATGALESCHALLNCARSLGDEPATIAMLVRVACRMMAVSALERILAQGEPSPAGLVGLQQLLEKEEAEPLLLTASRGDRAAVDWMVEGLQMGELTLDELFKEVPKGDRTVPRDANNIKLQRAALLRHHTQLVEAMKLPVAQRAARVSQLSPEMGKAPFLVRHWSLGGSALMEADARSQAQLRCAIAAVAAERHRQERGTWPDSLAALAAKGYLKAVPADPFDGAPLRWRPLPDGVLIYSVGQDGKDDGGNLDRTDPTREGTDIGVRLWDVSRRRQPPLPPPKNPPAPDGGIPEGPPAP
ncbi:MAG TPA: hypothetical protein VEL76_40060 [Gemmataceae bacterium]|nr:hypothetical protein [Gemmataceae bacterium]